MITLTKKLGRIAEVVNIPPSRFEILVIMLIFVVAPFGYGMLYFAGRLQQQNSELLREQTGMRADLDEAITKSDGQVKYITDTLTVLSEKLVDVEVQAAKNTLQIERLATQRKR